MSSPVSRPVFGCTQCQMLSINGLACHETGCPNEGAWWNPETGEWEHYTECTECGAQVLRGESCDCLDDWDDNDRDDDSVSGPRVTWRDDTDEPRDYDASDRAAYDSERIEQHRRER